MMSDFNISKTAKKLIAAASLISLTACGFTPLHAPSTQSNLQSNHAAQGLHGAVDIKFNNTHRTDQSALRAQSLLRQALITRLGEPVGAPRYELTLSPQFTRESVGVTEDYIDSRYDLRLNIDFSLTDLRAKQDENETSSANSSEPLNIPTASLATSPAASRAPFATSLQAITTFAAPSNTYALNAAQTLAEDNLTREASDRLILRLSGYLKSGL